jgi:hypothetical protein
LRSLFLNRAPSILLLIIWITYFFCINRYGLWAYVGVPHMDPLYGDLHAILSAIDCDQRGVNVFVNNPCDALGRVHVYGSIWLSLSIFGVDQASLSILGSSINILFMTVVVTLINPRSISQFAIAIIILFSPAVTLGLERANNDLILFILTALSALLLALRSRAATVCSLCLIGLSSALKIYPSILFGAVLLALKWRRKELVFILVLSSLLITFWLLTSLSEILLLKDLVPKPLDHYTTGAKALFVYLSRPYPQILLISEIAYLAIFVCFVVASALWLARRIDPSPFQSMRLSLQFVFFIFGLTILFFTYTVNSNYDYRWIFFILSIPYLFCLQQASSNHASIKKMATLSFICASIVMWTEALRAGNFFGFLKFNTYFNIGRSTFSIELVQQFLKELAAWVLFVILFALAIKQFSKR